MDFGSTYSFLSYKWVVKHGIPIEENRKFHVSEVDGGIVVGHGVCRHLPLRIQGHSFGVTFYLLDIVGCDAILGTQWLKLLGPIMWEFFDMWMKFWHNGVAIQL